MPIYIAKNYDGDIESVVLAKSYDLAYAFWQGQGVIPHHVDIKQEKDLENHPTGVLPLVKTKRKTIRPSDVSSRTGQMELLVIEK